MPRFKDEDTFKIIALLNRAKVVEFWLYLSPLSMTHFFAYI